MIPTMHRSNKPMGRNRQTSFHLSSAWVLLRGVEKSIAFGGKLDYCKSQIEHGKWLKFLEYCGVPERTASGMMRMHKHRELLREKSAENWIDADRLIRAETNPNRQRIADLTAVGVVSNPVPKLDAKALLGPSNQVVIEQPKSVPEFTSEVPPLETSNEPLKAPSLVKRRGG